MSRDLLSRYIWIIDTLRHYGSLTRDELNRLWVKSRLSDGQPLPRRTFYTYRNAIEELFKISIDINPSTYEYSIETSDDHYDSVVTWLLNSASIGSLLNDARDIADRIFLEDVPSARMFMPVVVDALKTNHTLRISYHPYTRTIPTSDIYLEPYFLKIFKQRWYVTGRNVGENRIKTYALDRITEATMLPTRFEIPADFSPKEYFAHSYGIIFDEGTVKRVAIKADQRQAKYLRSVPLHHSQQEVIHDSFSIFYYNIRLTSDFIHELLSFGPRITVLQPPELREQMIESLRHTLDNYTDS